MVIDILRPRPPHDYLASPQYRWDMWQYFLRIPRKSRREAIRSVLDRV